MSEPVLFDHPMVQVTASAVHVRNGGSYFLSQISSVHVARENNWLVIALGVAILMVATLGGLIAAFSAMGSALMTSGNGGDGVSTTLSASMSLFLCGAPSLLLAVAGVALLVMMKPTYWLVLVTSAGQVRALSSKDASTVQGIQSAVVGAMANRG